MGNMSQKQYTESMGDRLSKDPSRIPSHLLPKTGAKIIEPESIEGLNKMQMETTIMRFETLLNEINGSKLIS